MRTDVLRVFVNVPQVFATGIKVSESAAVYLRDDPQRQFPGKVTRTADALDPNTRTLLTEVRRAQPGQRPAAGDVPAGQVRLRPQRHAGHDPRGGVGDAQRRPRVAILDSQQRLQYRSVQLGRDFGAEIAVIAGLNGGEAVVVHPGDDIPEGTVVEPVATAK